MEAVSIVESEVTSNVLETFLWKLPSKINDTSGMETRLKFFNESRCDRNFTNKNESNQMKT